ncbi:MAG: CDP-glucose 4,6-dehydratase [Thermoanaerobaculia bacterium]|nr:CDP-glucose 4,6-dehydratase [Thermoanaerobaculia bacterium]
MTFWKGRSVFVTGATGFLGSWLTRELLDRGARLTVLVRDWDPQSELIRSGRIRECTVVSGEVESFSTLERAILEAEADTVIHLAAQALVGVGYHAPLLTFESNVRGSYNLLEACRRHPEFVRRVVVASSDKAYGTGPALPYTEAMPAAGRHPYDVSKSCTDLLAQTYAETYGLPVAISRSGNLYGGGDLNWSRIVPGTIRSVLHNERPIIRSDGTFLRDYVFVKDAVSAYLLLAEKLQEKNLAGEAFNFGPARPVSVVLIAGEILKLMGRTDLSLDIQNTARAEIRDQYLDAGKAREILGWAPRWSLEEGLTEAIRWYRDFLAERK